MLKKNQFKMFLYSMYGVQIWNLGILIGCIFFCYNIIKKYFNKNKITK